MKKNLNIILSGIALLIIIVTSIFIFSNTTKASGTIHLYVEGENKEVLCDKMVPFYKEDMLIDVLRRYLEIEEGTLSQSKMVIGINGTHTDISKNYFKFIINCEFATHGAWDQSLNDGDDVRIIYSDISDWNAGC